MKCARCKRELVIHFHVSKEKWELLARKWWEKVLCLECFFVLVSHRQRTLTIFSMDDFHSIVLGANRVRGYLHNAPWPFPRRKKEKL